MTCPHCLEKDERIWELERELGMLSKPDVAIRLASALRVSPGVSATLSALWTARTAFVRKDHLLHASAPIDREDDRELKIVDVYISRLRAALKSYSAIETVWGRGYRLSDEGRERVAAILGEGRAA